MAEQLENIPQLGPKPEGKKRVAFSGWPMIIAWIGMIIFAMHASTHMVGAGDTWVALACGRHFINHGVDTVEPFSANSHKAGPTEETMAAYARQLRYYANKEKGVKSWFRERQLK